MNFLRDYQTLIAALLQVLVAIAALWPVYRQMNLTRIQSAIATREVLIERVEAMIRQRQQTNALLYGITDEFARVIFQNDPEQIEVPDVDPQWAHAADQQALNTIGALSDMQDGKADPQIVDEARERVIKSAHGLNNFLRDLHQWESVDFDDPDNGVSNPAAAREHAIAASDKAAMLVGTEIKRVKTCALELDAAYERAIDALRSRIRQINELVLKTERSKLR